MRRLLVATILVVASVGPATAYGGIDERTDPLADAGLDQSVEVGATVLLDGSGSRDPDGRITDYEWRIETPAGEETTPEERTAPRTSFVAAETGRYVVTLTVTDDTGATASDALYVDVEASETVPPTPSRTDTPNPATPDPTPEATSPPVDRAPTIRGPQVVTGDRPLEGEYTVATGGPVEDVVWTIDGDRRATGETIVRAWEPGDHTLSARVTFSDGRTETATFEDGETRVVADPRPSVSLPSVDRQERLAGTATATDEYGNLASLTVSVDGLGTERVDADSADGERLETDFDWTDVEPGREYDLVATAVDERGQRATVNRTIRPAAPPETLSAEFVNGPVDSYHPRIDADRYTAHHELKIELNGNSVDDIDFEYHPKKESIVHEVAERKVSVSDGIATVHSYWAGDTPRVDDPYRLQSTWSFGNANSEDRLEETSTSFFTVVPSDPEIRIQMLNDGGRPIGGSNYSDRNAVDFRETIRIDASRSFDPDGSGLRFGWDLGAEPISESNETARLSGFESGRFILKDGYGNEVYQNWSAQETYVPAVTSMDVVGDEPYAPDQRVEVAIRTQVVQFRRNTATLDIGAELRGAPGEVTEWNERLTDDQNSFAYEGTVELPASALAEDGPDARIVLYNADRPDHAAKSEHLPTVEVSGEEQTYLENLEVEDVRYLVRERTVDTVIADSRAEMRQLRNGGYEVAGTSTRTTEYRIDERVQTRERKVRTETEAFGSTYNRRLFLSTHPEWQSDGVRTDRRRVSETTVSWKRTRESGYTGDTRRVLVDSADYLVEREYAYTTTEPRTREVTTRQCPLYGGCYEVTYERTVYVDVTRTYWAQSKRSFLHSATGDVRRTLVDPAEYATEYRHETTTWTTETEREYLASRDTIVQSAEYEWQTYDTVTSERTATRLTADDPTRRIGNEVTERYWTMERLGTEDVVRPAYTTADTVVGTRATVTGDVVRYQSTGSGQTSSEVVDEFTTEFSTRGLVDESDIVERVRESEGDL